jgi:hypothetical protein
LDHPGELSRLLNVFHRLGASSIGIRELQELTDRTAGSSYRYPNPLGALGLAETLGLIRRSGKSVSLTQRGEFFSKSFSANPSDLSIDQGKLILGILLDEFDFRRRVRALIAKFGTGTDGTLQLHASVIGDTSEDRQTAIFLQQVGALGYRDGVLFVNMEFEEILPLDLISSARLDEETLWKRLEAQRLRARAAEEYVLEFEKHRLAKLGRPDLAELVVRISTLDVSAGYDIKSFESDGSPRRVEVKSSTGTKIRFEWSDLERTYAAKAKKIYWIYFVPLAHTLPNLPEPLAQIQDPVAEIASGRFLEKASSFIVEVTKHVSH